MLPRGSQQVPLHIQLSGLRSKSIPWCPFGYQAPAYLVSLERPRYLCHMQLA